MPAPPPRTGGRASPSVPDGLGRPYPRWPRSSASGRGPSAHECTTLCADCALRARTSMLSGSPDPPLSKEVMVMDDLFVSSVNPEHWEPDPDVPGSEMHELVRADGMWAGLTRFRTVDGPTRWTPPQRETIHVLEGQVTIEVAGGPTIHLDQETWPPFRPVGRPPGTSPPRSRSSGSSPSRPRPRAAGRRPGSADPPRSRARSPTASGRGRGAPQGCAGRWRRSPWPTASCRRSG